MAETVSRRRFALVRFKPGVPGETGLWVRWSNTRGVFWRTENVAWDFNEHLDVPICNNLFIPNSDANYKRTHTAYIQDVRDLVAVLKLLGLKQNEYEYGSHV